MALSNFSLPFGSLAPPIQSWSANLSPQYQLAANTNNLLYAPAEHQQQINDGAAQHVNSDNYKNNPYAPPELHQTEVPQKQIFQLETITRNNNSNMRRKSDNTYLPPIPTPGARNTYLHQQKQYNTVPHLQQQLNHFTQQNLNNNEPYRATGSLSSSSASVIDSRTYAEGTYSRLPNSANKVSPVPTFLKHNQQQHQYFNTFNANKESDAYRHKERKTQLPASANGVMSSDGLGPPNNDYTERPAGFTRVQAGQGSRTQVHAVLDYDVEDDGYYDDADHVKEFIKDGNGKHANMPTVTPIQGPIFLKNGTVPVVPLFSYPSLSNSTFVQIPIWWTALSVALGLDVRGDIIKGVPCIKRFHQLFCPTAGNNYPIDKIERFIDDNKALMRRMYGDFEINMNSGGPQDKMKKRKRRFIDEPDLFIPPGTYSASFNDENYVHPHSEEAGESYFGKLRQKRQSAGIQKEKKSNEPVTTPGTPGASLTGRLDACESKVEIVTPYWASNSAGKIRAIVNTQHFEQAIHQEICSKSQTSRCEKGCGCEQKYKWHRLLAYDPDNDCKGIFMDWFLFPSCCVCRCDP